MPQSRKNQICLSQTPYYHCISRCVRRALLCGKDIVTGKSYEHRRSWVENKLLHLSEVFSIDVCAYAVMHNHTHIVLHVDSQTAENWSIAEVLTKWHSIFKGTFLTKKYLDNNSLTKSEILAVEQLSNKYRQRLTSISWFMRVLNESIARAANKEDECTGRFWEGRFKSQALLSQSSLLACMAYVDLNPVRAGIARNLKTSEYTSIKMRIIAALENSQPKQLMKFSHKNEKLSGTKALPFNLNQYINLLERSCESLRKQNHLYNTIVKKELLKQVGIQECNWAMLISNFESLFHGAVGCELSLTQFHNYLNHKRRPSVSNCQKLLE